jgi:hypothetical protein|tara:strand:- start:273 stop:458 length:186 start_codon:yes stop_codon:yes gene_type:complete
MQIQRGLDWNVVDNVAQIEKEAIFFRDMDQMPLAPHRVNMPNHEEQYWWFHRTQTSMADFV